jgi:TfoX/Sxy family transcriptional regulator of competence genes
MSRYGEFVEFVIEQMSFIGGLRVRAMFGGYGISRDDRIFAIIVGNRKR